MQSDAEVVEVLARVRCGNQHGSCTCAEIGNCAWFGAEALAALRSAGYAVVKAGKLDTGGDYILEYTIKIARNGDVTNDVATHGNSFAEIYKAFHAVKAEIERQIVERRNCPFNPRAATPFTKDPTNA